MWLTTGWMAKTTMRMKPWSSMTTSWSLQRPARIIGILLLLASVLLLLFQLDDGVFFLLIQLYDGMSPGFVSPALIEELLTTSSRHITSYQKKSHLIWCILMSASSLVFSSKLSLLSTVSSTANSHVLNMVRHLENKKTLMSTTIIKAYHILSKKSQLMWYILMSASSLVFSSKLSSPCTVSSTTKPHEQKLGKWGIK